MKLVLLGISPRSIQGGVGTWGLGVSVQGDSGGTEDLHMPAHAPDVWSSWPSKANIAIIGGTICLFIFMIILGFMASALEHRLLFLAGLSLCSFHPG